MLITNAEVFALPPDATRNADIRLEDGHIAAIGNLRVAPGETIFDACGGAVLPGLHDHHIHLLSYAASLDSVACGPPQVNSARELASALQQDRDRSDWLRGYGYHESVAGEIDNKWLDDVVPDRPVRVQHRSGRLWMLNTAALQMLRENGATRAELPLDGRWYDQDIALGDLVGKTVPPVSRASRRLASFGVTGLTDMTPTNTSETFDLMTDLSGTGDLLQSVTLAGTSGLSFPVVSRGARTGATKIHLHESALPPFPELCARITCSHQQERAVAVHCVTETELVFTLAALRESGVRDGDRIEHASVTPPELVEQLKALNLIVVTQPNFIPERGDAYLDAVPTQEHAWLYRVGTFLDAGIRTAGGTDAPFGNADPWLAMRAAVTRTTASGRSLGRAEQVSPEAAVALFMGSADEPATPKRVTVGAVADLCILDSPWRIARRHLSSHFVAATLCSGELIFDRVDQAKR